jgi:uncharacterized RDD family membrane protein YckC
MEYITYISYKLEFHMDKKYCDKCGVSLMQTMRMCSGCGNKSFSSSPVQPVKTTFTQSNASTYAYSGVVSQPNIGSLTPAGNWARLGAAIIDSFALTLLGFAIIAILGGLYFVTGSNNSSPYAAIYYLLLLPLHFAYFTYFHSSIKQATWGKQVAGIKVVKVTGESLTASQAFVRCLVQYSLPILGYVAIALSFAGAIGIFKDDGAAMAGMIVILGLIAVLVGPYITVFFNPQHQTLIDMICKTVVVKK